jgi:hypothetical protein
MHACIALGRAELAPPLMAQRMTRKENLAMPASILQWKDANSGPKPKFEVLCRHSRIEQLARLSVRSREVEPNLYWVLLNLPNRTSCTLYLGNSKPEAALTEAVAYRTMAHILEYALPD